MLLLLMWVPLMSDWSVLVSMPKKTEQVSEGLKASAIEHFIPREEITYIHNGRHQRRERPMLGRYVLYVVNELWRTISSIRGVSGLLLSNDYEKDTLLPAVVDQTQIDFLREICVNGVYRARLDAERTGFTYGQRVSPTTGPLAFHVGKYDGLSKRGEFALFNLFGREQKITFKPGELVAA